MKVHELIELNEEDALRCVADMRRIVDGIEFAVKNGLRVKASVGGDPGVVQKALELDTAVRQRQLLYDVERTEGL